MNIQKKVIISTIIVSIVLMIIKYLAYFFTGSLIILSDATESIVNIITSCFALYSVSLSNKPRDKSHPYGHGKIEYFAIGIEGILISIAGLLILAKTFFSFFEEKNITDIEYGVYLIGATAILNYIMGGISIHYGKKTSSLTLVADGKHLQTDTISTIGAIIGLIIVKYTGYFIIDSILSIVIGLYIIYEGIKLSRKFVSGLMDETNFEIMSNIAMILNKNKRENWIDLHNLRTQQYGHSLHIDCHLTLPSYFTLKQVNQEVKQLNNLLSSGLNYELELFVHTDPCTPSFCHYCTVKNCDIRQYEFKDNIAWTSDNLMEDDHHNKSEKKFANN